MYSYGIGSVTYDEEVAQRGDVFTTIDVFRKLEDSISTGDKILSKEARPVLVISTDNVNIVRCMALSTKPGDESSNIACHRDICIPTVNGKYRDKPDAKSYIDTSQVFTINVWQLKYKLAHVRSDIVDKAVALNLLQDMEGESSMLVILQTLRKEYPEKFSEYISWHLDKIKDELREEIRQEYEDNTPFVFQVPEEEESEEPAPIITDEEQNESEDETKPETNTQIEKFTRRMVLAEKYKSAHEVTVEPTEPEYSEENTESEEMKVSKRPYTKNPIQITCFQDALDLYEEWKAGNRDIVCANRQCTKNQYNSAKNRAKKILLKSNRINATDWKN